jgi:hypothetical protein
MVRFIYYYRSFSCPSHFGGRIFHYWPFSSYFLRLEVILFREEEEAVNFERGGGGIFLGIDSLINLVIWHSGIINYR